jgi:site-specific DNA-methyltransferase (adenine-specific)
MNLPVNQIICGDNMDTLRTLPNACIDSCVTDPPYGLAFMGKKWDYDVPSSEVWQECLRVLKPGGHLLAFAGTRTQHRMAVRIEDAGFEIRDMIAWVYGSGFPKSLDVSKAIDKAAGAEREVVGVNPSSRPNSKKAGMRGFDNRDGAPDQSAGIQALTAPATEAANQWAGWGTSLKPALEPITVARKPFPGTVAENVLQHGTGALNVDGCRVGDESGRFPANLIHDGSEEVVGLFPETGASNLRPPTGKPKYTGSDRDSNAMKASTTLDTTLRGHNDAGGSAARFFYCAKADSSERRNSKHPTIKPVALMRYLVRLVCPAGGVVLDPFAGSGTTIEAARLEHCRAIGIEREAEYCADILERLRQGVLF